MRRCVVSVSPKSILDYTGYCITFITTNLFCSWILGLVWVSLCPWLAPCNAQFVFCPNLSFCLWDLYTSIDFDGARSSVLMHVLCFSRFTTFFWSHARHGSMGQYFVVFVGCRETRSCWLLLNVIVAHILFENSFCDISGLPFCILCPVQENMQVLAASHRWVAYVRWDNTTAECCGVSFAPTTA